MKTATRLMAGASLLAATTGTALAAPRAVADIAPVHSILASVMTGAGSPDVLLPPGASPHGYALRPSEAEMLERADLVFWIGEALTPWLDGPLHALATGARIVTLSEADGVALLAVREGGPFEPHAHDHAHDHAHAHAQGEHAHDEHDDDHAHDDHPSDNDPDDNDGHAHDHDHDHDDDDVHHEHVHDDHAHHGHDSHLWLDPVNAAAFAAAMAEALAEADPGNAGTYRANAEAFAAEMDALAAELDAALASLRGRGYFVFHDAYQYFEARFGLPASGSIALHDADQPSAARVAAIQARIRDENIACVFAEPQFEPRLLATAVEGSGARAGVLDPLGADLESGADLYPTLMRELAAGLSDCLAP